MLNTEGNYAYQLGETHRANLAAQDWETVAQQWRSHAEKLQAELDRARDIAAGGNALIRALKAQLAAEAPNNPYNVTETRLAVYVDGINKDRLVRSLNPITDEEISALG